eukprot:CAMPEP_0119307832 /NCGR_PEP_ID=MMETSP1333-20130426/8222_1 /TAXON_ID=418940 /ORGANISM="Scyphosphaera apsteinii, Strain RCC1455" /LENGTH=201 /DNA_ID=CAMNT_0007311467 /DNA_START=311 /DNA_END=916 /DNA_ORIENTATION=+
MTSWTVDFTLLDMLHSGYPSGLADVAKFAWAETVDFVLPASLPWPPRVQASVWGDGMEGRELIAVTDLQLCQPSAKMSVRLQGVSDEIASVALQFAYEIWPTQSSEPVWATLLEAVPHRSAEHDCIELPDMNIWLKAIEPKFSTVNAFAAFLRELSARLPSAAHYRAAPREGAPDRVTPEEPRHISPRASRSVQDLSCTLV